MQQTSKSENLRMFIEASKNHGAADGLVVDLLREQGWSAKDVYAAFGSYYQGLTGLAVPVRAGGAGEMARDAFLYLLGFSTLATWTIALGSLMFSYIDRWFPDPLMHGLQPRHEIAGEMACIIVAFPVYLLAQRFILREVEKRPEKLESGVRKWLTYIALLIAAGTVIADLITFLTFFLQGELTARFVYKVLSVMAIAGGVFWYYLGSLKRSAPHGDA